MYFVKQWMPRNQPCPSTPYSGELHFTAFRTLGTVRTMSASRRFPRSRFQPGIAAIYACTGASPSAFAICGLPPERRTTPAVGGDLDFVAALRGLLARDVPLALGFALLISASSPPSDSRPRRPS